MSNYSEDQIDRFLRACGGGHFAAARKLIDSGMPVNIANSVGYTPLMSAARNFKLEMVEMLLAAGADVHARSDTQETALHAALGSSAAMPEWHTESLGPTNADLQCGIVEMLLEAGADIEAKSYIGMTPLMKAAWFGCSDAARILLGKQPDLEAVNENGQTARDIAVERGETEVVTTIDSA